MFDHFLREFRRRRAVRRLAPDGRADPSFDRYVERAAEAVGTPIALLSVAHGGMLWFKAGRGMAIASLARKDSFCEHVLDRREVLEVCDARADRRYRHLPVVTGPPGVRYYLGAQLTLAEGTGVGALCVLDTRPRPPASIDQRAYLQALAREAAFAFEMRGQGAWRLAA